MTVYFRPCGDLECAPEPRSDADRAFYARLSAATGMEIHIDPSVDYEDWMEPACMLEAAVSAGVEVAILPRKALKQAMAEAVIINRGAACPDMLIGRQLSADPYALSSLGFAWPHACNDRANAYAKLEAFTAHAGRKVQLAHMPGDAEMAGPQSAPFGKDWGTTTLGEAMLGFAGQDCLIKQVYPAKSMPIITLQAEAHMTPQEAESLFFEEMGFHFARFEGDRDALLVQEIVPMTHETRFFVVDGTVVTGAACIEAHTPRQSPGNGCVLPDLFEVKRNRGEMRRDPEAAEVLLAFAQGVADRIAAETPDLPHYVLDCALGADRKPLVIELNPIAQSGLYAIDASRLFNAILETAERDLKPAPDSSPGIA